MKLSILPHRLLQPYIDRYWVWEGAYELPKLLPGTGQELVFHYRTPYGYAQNEDFVKAPYGHVISIRKVCRVLKPSGPLGFISVRFRSGAFRYFCRQPVADLVDRFTDVRDIWGISGVEASERVASVGTLAERVSLIEQFVTDCFARHAAPSAWLDHIIHEIYYHDSFVRLQDCYRQWGTSDRNLQRKFKESVGVSPKLFQRISRFQSVVKTCLLENRKDYLTVALRHGYYDQSHFIKDFQHFTGEAPSRFLQGKNFLSHFYNRSFRTSSMMNTTKEFF